MSSSENENGNILFSKNYSYMGEDSVLYGILKRVEWLLNKSIINEKKHT